MRRLRSACRLMGRSNIIHITTGVVFSGDKSQFDFRRGALLARTYCRNARVECHNLGRRPWLTIGQSPPCTLVRTGWNYTLRKRSEFIIVNEAFGVRWSRGVVVRLRVWQLHQLVGRGHISSRTAGFSSRAVSPVVHAETKVKTTTSHCYKLLLG